MNIELLNWDSKFFERKVGKLILENHYSIDYLNEVDFDTVYVFSQIEQDSSWSSSLIEQRLTFSLDLNQFSAEIMSDVEVLNDEKWVESLQKLSIEAGHQSRFKKDPKLEPKFKELYELWAYKCLNQDTYAQVESNQITGFVSFNHNLFDLMAVHPNHRKKHLASRLFSHAISQVKEKGYHEVYVTTQASNKEGIGFFENQGFELVSKEFIYHIHK